MKFRIVRHERIYYLEEYEYDTETWIQAGLFNTLSELRSYVLDMLKEAAKEASQDIIYESPEIELRQVYH